MTLPRLHPSPTGTLVGVAALLFAVLLGSARSSTAQTERRYVLGKTVSYDAGERPSLSASDFVAAPDASTARRSGAPSPRPHRPPLRPDMDWTHVAVPAVAGVLGGGLGILVGGAAGAAIAEARSCTSFACGFGYPLLGALAGETVGLSSGVYLGTERRGSYLLTLLGGTAATVLVVGVGGDLVGSDADLPTLLALPTLQLAATIPIARSD
jgi:hypothetical protein